MKGYVGGQLLIPNSDTHLQVNSSTYSSRFTSRKSPPVPLA